MAASNSLVYRLYKMRLATGGLLSLPVALVVIWYAWSAFAQLDRYRRATEDTAPLNLELFHIVFHDELVRDLRRATLPPRPEDSPLPTFAISLPRSDLDQMFEQLYAAGDERSYVSGYGQKDGTMHDVSIRFRGSKPWHWLNTQKSMKVRLQRGDLIDGTRVFNLLNDPTPFGLEDRIILDLAREQQLLVPEYHAVRVRLNNADMGVYRYAAQPTEGLLRRGRRIPGNLYSGDSDGIDSTLGVGDLFSSRQGWQQVAWRAGEDTEEFGPLDELLDAVQRASFAEFARYAERSIDLDRYAIFDALDVVFGGNEHDYFSNHKLYYDPYRGKFEPVAWSFRGFQHEPWLNLVDHPLLIRLKMTPGYLQRRNRAVYSLLVGDASMPRVRERVDRLFAQAEDDLAADPYWDAYKLLPRVTRFHRFMARPMSSAKWVLAARAEMHGHGRRTRFLLDELERPRSALQAHREAPGLTRVALTTDGHGAPRLRDVVVNGPCEGAWRLRVDVDRNGIVDASDPQVASGAMGAGSVVSDYGELLPGAVLVAREARPDRGTVRVVPEVRTYPYWLTADCPPRSVAVVLHDQVTDRSSRLVAPVDGEDPAGPTTELPRAVDRPRYAVGQRSPHPWDYPSQPKPEAIQLGPGLVEVPRTRVFAAHQTVRIAAGTRIEMGPEASLVFHGPVEASGTRRQPVDIVAADPGHPFGGIAIQGPGSAGSTLRHMRIDGGTRVGDTRISYASLVNLFDTRDITIEAVRIAGTRTAEDVLHAAYVENLRLHEVEVLGAPTDGVDLEFTEGEVRGLRVVGAGDDCLDLMGAQVRVSDSVLLGCTNNALSVGEESDVSAHDLLIGDSDTGVLVKNASRLRLSRSLLFRTVTALKTSRRDAYYDGPSRIGASELFAVDCERAIDRAPGTELETERIRRALPGPGALEHLARHVLGLQDWNGLATHLARLQGEARGAHPL